MGPGICNPKFRQKKAKILFDKYFVSINSFPYFRYLWLRQEDLKNKTILELGSGTSLPGLLCAKFGASKVYLSDDSWQPNTLKNINEAVKINGLAEQPDRVQVKGLSWGDYTEELFDVSQDKLDFVIGE